MNLRYLILFIITSCCINFASAQVDSVKVTDIIITGNIKTRKEVIIRELPFKVNDWVLISDTAGLIEISENNLLNISLFNFVEIKCVTNSLHAQFIIDVEERWYYWIYPIFEQADRNLSSFLYYGDFTKINYGAAFDWHNFRGKNELLRFKLRLGYKEHYSISYQKNGFGEKRIWGIWALSEFFRQKKAISKIEENKPLYAENEKKHIKEYLNTGAGITFRPQINYRLNLGLLYQYSIYKDTSFFNTSFESGNYVKTYYIIPRIRYEYDNRNNKIYPTKGFYFSIGSAAYASVNNISENYFTLSTKAEFNTPVFKKMIFYKVSTFYNRFFNYRGNILFDKKLDFSIENIIRGYEYYYFISPVYINFQNTLNFRISDFRIHHLPKFLPKEFVKTYTKVYLDIFFDIGFTNDSKKFYEVNNPMNDKFIYSYGIGINVETYYDRLIQLHAVYNGYLNKIGIFVEYKTPIYKLF